jgi:phage-related protein
MDGTRNLHAGPDADPGTKQKPKLKILKADFGDGYTQPTPDGLHFVRRTLSLQWHLISPAQANALDGFLSRTSPSHSTTTRAMKARRSS